MNYLQVGKCPFKSTMVVEGFVYQRKCVSSPRMVSHSWDRQHLILRLPLDPWAFLMLFFIWQFSINFPSVFISYLSVSISFLMLFFTDSVAQACLTLYDPMPPTRLLCPWGSLSKNTGAGCHALLQEIFPTQESSPCLLHLFHWQADSLPLHHLRSLNVMLET